MHTMVRTLVMLTGEFEYENMVQQKPNILTYIIFFLFVFVGSVFLMNLLVGLAVSDTNTTMEKADRTRLRLQIETINHVELMMNEYLRRKLWRGLKTVKPGGERTNRCNIQKMSYLFRWLGLPKTAIKRECSQVQRDPVSAVCNDDKEKEKQKLKERKKEDLKEIRNALNITQKKLLEMEKSFTDLVETIRQEQVHKTSETRRTYEIRMMDADD